MPFQSKTYDSVTEKYLDFSFEKTNSAYMLFYERRLPEHLQRRHSELLATPTPSPTNEEKPDTEEPVKIEGVSNMTVDEISTVEEPAKNEVQVAQKDKQKQNEQENIVKEKEENSEELEKTANCDNVKSNSNNNNNNKNQKAQHTSTSKAGGGIIAENENGGASKLQQFRPLLSKELEDWIWQDNRQFLQDRNIFEHTYFK